MLNGFRFRMGFNLIIIFFLFNSILFRFFSSLFFLFLKRPTLGKVKKFSQFKNFFGMDCGVFLINFQPVKRLHVVRLEAMCLNFPNPY